MDDQDAGREQKGGEVDEEGSLDCLGYDRPFPAVQSMGDPPPPFCCRII